MIEYGLSVPGEEHFDKLPVKKLSRFDFIEFSGGLLDSDAARRKLESLRKAGCALVVKDLLDPSLVHLVQSENLQVRLEFDRKLHERCAAAKSVGADTAGADFDIAKALEYPAYGTGLIQLLKSTLATFNENSLEIAVPGRIPSPPGVTDVTGIFKFISRLSYPEILTALEMHIHEPGAFSELENNFDIIRFHRQFWRIFYEPEHGNYLSSSLLRRFFDLTDMKSVVKSRIAIAPGSHMPDNLLIDEILKLISEIEDEY